MMNKRPIVKIRPYIDWPRLILCLVLFVSLVAFAFMIILPEIYWTEWYDQNIRFGFDGCYDFPFFCE